MEQDCPPYMQTFRGVAEGTPKLLELFEQEGVPATFFTTGEVARRFPETVKAIVAGKHELGCHGDTHRRFDQMEAPEAKKEISDSTNTLREFYPVTSFRAPNLVFPEAYLEFLVSHGYQLDSSQARYKRAFKKNGHTPSQLRRLPASVTSSVLRLPKLIRRHWLNRLQDPVVLFVHPWEFVDFRKSDLRLDCRFRTGEMALKCLQENIRFYKTKQANFLRIQDWQPEPGESPV